MDRGLSGKISGIDDKVSSELASLDEKITTHLQAIEKQSNHTSAALTDLTTTQLSQLEVTLNEAAANLKGNNEERIREVADTLTKAEEKWDLIKTELAEKVHTESVKGYRNVQSLVDELQEKIANLQRESQTLKGLKKYLIGATLIGIANLLMIIGMLLRVMGII
jgi:DNA repair exonuclease SbcCD ATPase subunit